jgi:small subunit ribosomal protein S4
MAVNKTPVAKRCKSLDLDPSYMGYDKKRSNRNDSKLKKKSSEYGVQLKEKQKAKFVYGVLEKQFRKYYEKADKMPGVTGSNLIVFLERRLDSVAFRMGIGRTRREARQIVSHAQVLVNGKCVNIPSYLVTAGDVIEVKESCKTTKYFKEVFEVTSTRVAPAWLDVDYEAMKGTVKALPKREEVDVPFNEQLIVELYSK